MGDVTGGCNGTSNERMKEKKTMKSSIDRGEGVTVQKSDPWGGTNSDPVAMM